MAKGSIWAGLALLAATGTAGAEGPCERYEELGRHVLELQEAMLVVIQEAKPVCAERALKRECARYRVEIAGFARQIKEVEAERAAAKKACVASKKAE